MARNEKCVFDSNFARSEKEKCKLQKEEQGKWR